MQTAPTMRSAKNSRQSQPGSSPVLLQYAVLISRYVRVQGYHSAVLSLYFAGELLLQDGLGMMIDLNPIDKESLTKLSSKITVNDKSH